MQCLCCWIRGSALIGKCVACDAGKFKNAGNTDCSNPGVGRCVATAATGATSCSTSAASKSAIDCPAGTYSNDAGAVSIGCTTVPAGSCASMTGTVGDCINTAIKGAKFAALCASGTYSNPTTISSCQYKCMSGDYKWEWDPAFRNCNTCRRYNTEALCNDALVTSGVCGIACVNPGVGKCVAATAEATVCPNAAGAQAALSCPAGTYSNVSGAVTAGCLNPGVGRCVATAATGATSCSTSAASKSAIDCPAGTYSNVSGAVTAGCLGLGLGLGLVE